MSSSIEAKLRRDGRTTETIATASAVSVSIGSITRLDSWDVLTNFQMTEAPQMVVIWGSICQIKNKLI